MAPGTPRRGGSPISLAAELELASEVERMSPFHTHLNSRRISDAPPPGSPVTPTSSSTPSPNATAEASTAISSTDVNNEKEEAEEDAIMPAPASAPLPLTQPAKDTTGEWKFEDEAPVPMSTAGPVARPQMRKGSFSSALGRRFSGLARGDFARRQDSVDSFMSEPVSYGESNYMSQDLWITQKSLGMVSGERPTSGLRMGGPDAMMGLGGGGGGGVGLGGGSFSNINEFYGQKTRAAWRRRRKGAERGNIDDIGGSSGAHRISMDMSARLKKFRRNREDVDMTDRKGFAVDEDADPYRRKGWGGFRRKRRGFGRDHMFEPKEKMWSAATRRKVRDRIKRWWSGRRMKKEFFA